MPTSPAPHDFQGLTDSRYFPDSAATPPALAEDLGALNQRLLSAATTPWVATCIHCDGDPGSGDGLHMSARVGPGTQYLQPYVARCTGATGSTTAMTDTETAEETATYKCLLPSPLTAGADTYPITGAVGMAIADPIVDATPSADEQRLLQIATLTWYPTPVKYLWGTGVSIALNPIQVPDLETL